MLPQTTGLGLQWRENSWTLFTEVVFEQWRVAQNQLTRGLPIASPKQDLKNTLNTYLGGSFKVSDHEIKISYGYEPSNLGDGQKFVKSTAIPSEQQASDVTVEGMTFGNISGINRSIFGLGWQRKLEFLSSQKTKIPGYGALGFYSMSGSRTVPEGFSQEGTYKINLNMFTFGGAYRL